MGAGRGRIRGALHTLQAFLWRNLSPVFGAVAGVTLAGSGRQCLRQGSGFLFRERGGNGLWEAGAIVVADSNLKVGSERNVWVGLAIAEGEIGVRVRALPPSKQ